MTRLPLILVAAAACVVGAARVEAALYGYQKPGHRVATHADVQAARHAQGMSWNGGYAYTATGLPVALVVPPTAHMQTNWGWGVSQDTVTPIYHQFNRRYPGDFDPSMGYGFAPTPRWPSHTSQFGVYYGRGPY